MHYLQETYSENRWSKKGLQSTLSFVLWNFFLLESTYKSVSLWLWHEAISCMTTSREKHHFPILSHPTFNNVRHVRATYSISIFACTTYSCDENLQCPEDIFMFLVYFRHNFVKYSKGKGTYFSIPISGTFTDMSKSPSKLTMGVTSMNEMCDI